MPKTWILSDSMPQSSSFCLTTLLGAMIRSAFLHAHACHNRSFRVGHDYRHLDRVAEQFITSARQGVAYHRMGCHYDRRPLFLEERCTYER